MVMKVGDNTIVTLEYTLMDSSGEILESSKEDGEYEIYLHDNGKHLDIIIPNKHQSRYKAYGWGSKIFFMEVPTWDDLTCKIALQALFTKPESCMRVEYYSELNGDYAKLTMYV